MSNPPDALTSLALLLCAYAMVLSLALAISAALVRAGCGLHNRMSSPEHHIPVPSFAKALLIATPMVGVKLVVRVVLTVALVAIADADASQAKMIKFVSSTISLPLAILGTALLAAYVLPAPFGRGLLATLAAYAIAFCIALPLLIVVVMVVFAVRLLG